MGEIIQGTGKKPWAKAFSCGGDTFTLTPPDHCQSFAIGPDRDNTGSGVPTEYVFIFSVGVWFIRIRGRKFVHCTPDRRGEPLRVLSKIEILVIHQHSSTLSQ